MNQDLINNKIDRYELSVRTYNLLCHADIYTIGDLINKSPRELIKISGLGRKVLNEVKEYLAERGFTLATEKETVKTEGIVKLMVCSALNGYMVATGDDFSVFRNPKWIRVFETSDSLLKWIEENLILLHDEGNEI